MKDFFNRRQRFSLRKYSIGVCSVLLGTALFAAHGAQLRKEQIWKGETRIPDEIFLDNVLFHRVNTEGITSCRPLFYVELQERVGG